MQPSSPSRITIRDIAEALGLSRAAISLGLRNSPHISPSTCKRIQKTAAKMGYLPNLSAANLASFRHSSAQKTVHAAIAWLNSWEKPPSMRQFKEFDLYWQNAFLTAESAGYRLEEFVVDSETNVARLQSIFLTRNIRGIIIPPQQQSGYWKKLDDAAFDWSRFSAVRIGHSVQHPSVSIVAPDQVGNCMLAIREMTLRGYKRVGYVAVREIRTSTRNWFLGGYHLAQIALPSAQNVPVLYLDEKDPLKDTERLDHWMQRHNPDAILTELNEIPQMLRSLKVSVPKDLGLAVLNTLDSEVKAGIYQNPELIGRASAEILTALLNRNERGGTPDYRTTTIMGTWQDGPTLPSKAG
ncbi:MAG: LacI family DNA-binding transcriptional regulator [Verrucomicrobiota bacterium]